MAAAGGAADDPSHPMPIITMIPPLSLLAFFVLDTLEVPIKLAILDPARRRVAAMSALFLIPILFVVVVVVVVVSSILLLNPPHLLPGQGNTARRIKCAAGRCTRYSVWGYPWSILRFGRIVPHRRPLSGHELFVHGRLRRPGLLLARNGYVARGIKSPVSQPHYYPSWQPRESTNYASVRLLRRMPAKIRQCECVEALYRYV
jgi:hypothetical protein